MFAGIVAGILSLIAYIPRALKIIRNGSRSRNIWLVWTLSNFFIILSYYNLGARSTIWVPLAYFTGSAAITILSFVYSSEEWKTIHKWLLVVAIICTMRWWFSSNPLIDLGFNVLIYMTGYVMIINTKLRSKKKEEWVVTWALYFSGAIINLLALTDWSLQVSTYPMILFVMNGIVFSITLKRYLSQSKQQEPTEQTGLEM